jgi:hypothetical protein
MGRDGMTESPLPNTLILLAQGGSISERWDGSISERCQEHSTENVGLTRKHQRK